ncbi:alpha-L-arabinofuranosidase C-terminal domain-containing protein [Silvibacterium sp.]|uniref:alpha-L-arabinofuranosidase C-terminal domain-containing protein n=1 Tax=Silvibacterium sp. TaxID=1964179 RepID=UPI0039E6CA50
MTEEINYSYDGGLYAEMVRNRTFRNAWKGQQHWLVVEQGESKVEMKAGTEGPSAALPNSLLLEVKGASDKDQAGIANDGYWGMALQPSTVYQGSFYAKPSGVHAARLRLVANRTGATLAETTIRTSDSDWKRFAFTLKTGPDVGVGAANHLELTFDHAGSVELQLVSLFPPTFQDRPNGNRPDLMKMMAAMHPHFLRLPGGNYLEGDTVKDRFNWKETIGPLVDRPTHRSPWNYQSNDGMGLLEFLEWCEDLKVEPVLAVFAGYSLHGEHVVGKDLEPFIQEDLDEVEYVTGDKSTKWGALRARDGHPEPFPLHYIEIGNEDWFDKAKTYDDRFDQIANAIRGKYGRRYSLIATMPIKKGNPDLIDDHYYQTPEEFFAMDKKYDTMDRKGPKIFIGEWATRTGSPTPDFGAALGDAAWMTSMERNSDLIELASYAPLLTNVNPGGMQWTTDLIGYTADKAYGSPSYWAQVLFGQHIGDHLAKTEGSGLNSRFFWSATVSTGQKMLHLKLVNASDREQPLTIDLVGASQGAPTIYRLHADSRFATNTIDQPNTIEPQTSKETIASTSWKHNVAANTIEVIDIPLK